MSVANPFRTLDRRYRENRLYVFAQIYVLAGVLSTLGFYVVSLIFVPRLVLNLGWLNLLAAVTFTAYPFSLGLEYAAGMLVVSTGIVYWRYKRIYRRENHG